MKVLQAQALGMCFGVRDALAAIRHIEQPAQVTVFGQLVHNPAVSHELARRGFAQLDEPDRDAAAPATPRVLITAHGISDRQRAALARDHDLIDTTCPLVKKAHLAAVALARAGFFVVIIGQRHHVEVRGLTGDLPENQFDIVETQMGVRRYPAPRIGVMAQTTAVEADARQIVAGIRQLNPQAEVRFVNTICQPTRDRQAAMERLLTQIDVLVVVGGHHSNNTRQLVARARDAGIRALHVEAPDELAPEMFNPDQTVGLTAGTSTLPETIAAVYHRLTEFFPDPCPAPVVSIAGQHLWHNEL